MKVKVKGLVFVGFAAAVFAQSAFATITPNENDKKVVTSKYYVDTTFQEEEDKVPSTPTGADADTIWASAVKYPSMAVLKDVKDSLDAVGVIDDGAGYVDVQPGTGNNAGKYIVGLDKVPVTDNEGITGTFGNGDGNKLVTAQGVKSLIDTTAISSSSDATHLPTSQAVYTYAQDKSDRVASINNDSTDTTNYNGNSSTKYTSVAAVTGYAEATANKLAYDNGETITANKTSDVKFPTAKNVYEFVKAENAAYQPKVATASTANAVSIGYKADANSDATWGSLAGTGYVTISGSEGVYTADIDSNQIATSSDYVTTNTDLATAGGVYDFVNGNYQAKAATGANTIEVGHNGAWANLVGDTYTSVAMDGSDAKVSLTNITTGSNSTEFVASSDATNSGNRIKLARAGDVYDFVTGLTGGLTIPEMPDYCDTAAQSGGYCALVYGVSSGTAGQQGATYALQWTVMAQPTGN